jgi:hypothetical protein
MAEEPQPWEYVPSCQLSRVIVRLSVQRQG